ncbi:MAG: hypothetical protein ACTSYC_02510 [Promethearchaeota archaeon]
MEERVPQEEDILKIILILDLMRKKRDVKKNSDFFKRGNLMRDTLLVLKQVYKVLNELVICKLLKGKKKILKKQQDLIHAAQYFNFLISFNNIFYQKFLNLQKLNFLRISVEINF